MHGSPQSTSCQRRGRVACAPRMKPSNNGTFSPHDDGVLVLVHGEGDELAAVNAGVDHELAAGRAGVFGVGGSGHGDDLELVAGEHHELVAGGGLGVLSLGHGDRVELVAGHTGDSWCHRAVVGAIGR